MDADAVVVGAGAAGLAAALWLAERSVSVIVLEGRERIGGRVRWESVGSVGVPAELGAEFIHGDAPETSALLREAGLAKVPTADTAWTRDADGTLRQAEDDFDPGDIFERVRSLAADESVDAFLHRFEADPNTREQARRARWFVEGFEAADPALASARAIADELHSGVDSTSSRPVGSYALLFAYLSERCARTGVDVRLETTVERIAWERGGVTIEARCASGPATFRARCAVITLPAGVLRAETGPSFFPPLPVEKAAALRGLEMGHAVRVTLAFRTPFWEHVAGGRYREAGFFRCEGAAYNALWTQLPLRSRTIVAWAGGPRARALDAATAEERIDCARDQVGELFGERALAQREFEGGVTHDWAADPFAYGAYSYVGTGGGTARADLGAPVADTLFFAGEATSTDGQGGTVSGAFETGTRAAREVIRALGSMREPSPIVP